MEGTIIESERVRGRLGALGTYLLVLGVAVAALALRLSVYPMALCGALFFFAGYLATVAASDPDEYSAKCQAAMWGGVLSSLCAACLLAYSLLDFARALSDALR